MSRTLRALCHLPLAAVTLLVSLPLTAVADDAAEFGDFLLEAMHWSSGLRRMDPVPIDAEQDLRKLAKLVFEVPHPPRFEDLEATVRAVMDPSINGDSRSDPGWQNSQKRLVDEVLKLVGHGAFRVDDSNYFSRTRKPPVKFPPSAQAQRSVWLVRVPDLGDIAPSVTECRNLKDLLSIPSATAVKGVALDLRGTRGGDFFDVTCLANAFVAPGTLLFHATRRPDEVLTFKASSKVGRTPIDLPLVILIDRNTERLPLMLATTLRNLDRAKLIGERPVDFDGTYFEEFRFDAFGEIQRRDKNDHDGVWLPMRIVMPIGEFSLPNGYPPDASLHVDVPVPPGDERALLRAAERTIEDIEEWRERKQATAEP